MRAIRSHRTLRTAVASPIRSDGEIEERRIGNIVSRSRRNGIQLVRGSHIGNSQRPCEVDRASRYIEVVGDVLEYRNRVDRRFIE